MDLIPRYLQAVRFWLPKKQQDDIIAELSQDLRDQIEEREAALGHVLTEQEMEALLRQRGSPIRVANGYLPQRYLIGPLLFPIYLFVLKVVTFCILAVACVGWIAAIVSAALRNVTHSTWHPPYAPVAGSLWTSWFASMGMVTLIFALIERTDAKSQLFEHWNPHKLPPLRPLHSIPRSSSVIEIAVNLCVVAWWTGNLSSPLNLHIGNVHLSFTPAWTWFYWGILLLTVGSACIAAVNLLRPWWTPTRIAARLCLDLAGAVFFCWLLRANIVAGIAWPGVTPEKAATVVAAVNQWLAWMFPWAVAISLLIAAINAWRLVRLMRHAGSPPIRAAAV